MFFVSLRVKFYSYSPIITSAKEVTLSLLSVRRLVGWRLVERMAKRHQAIKGPFLFGVDSDRVDPGIECNIMGCWALLVIDSILLS